VGAGRARLLRAEALALHGACLHAQPRSVQALLELTGDALLERRDCTGATPLIELARSQSGTVVQRVAILKLLLKFGANPRAHNKDGDTCLHWFLRNRDAVLTKAFFANCAHACDLLAHANHRGRTPLALARAACTESLAAYLAARSLPQTFQAKAQRHADRAAASERDRVRAMQDLLVYTLDDAQDLEERALAFCNEQHVAAELHRRDAEKRVVKSAVDRATEEAKLWLQGPYGSSELKTLSRTIKDDLRQRRGTGDSIDESIARAAREKATEVLLRRKVNEAKARAITDYRKVNPPLQPSL